ncbi:calmodulin-binding receptor-like cytoplasmic kinase 2 [Phragmites australis]|uniref:calmodulin-binding receptor-like cytoplasmic kinase 2 n=1 Tax=Phragmites australis TaxID=29695 RepID=UPI002D787EA5|nr:calmodulin-binding receptor-like cytoplasmic kinase 2 [Phragmites australis]
MAGRDRRGSLASSSSSSGRRTPEHERWAWSPAWSRPLSEGGGRSSRAASVRSLFRSIGIWFSSLSTSSTTSASASSSRKKKSKEEAAPAQADDAIKKPPLAGHTGRPPIRGLYSSSGHRNGRAWRQSFQSSVFTMEEILTATKNFSPALKIGQGGFGAVYKGVLPDGTVVAVKRAKMRMQNPHVDVEFRSEVKIMARIEHQSLVRFYGYMVCGEERIVVIEYVPNGTLREHLDRCNGRFLDFGTRLDIAIDVAHAVTYLHMYSDHPIIHRDIKSSNILLTDSLRAKVADFGFARLGAGEATHVTTQVKGTAGYLDPEYLKTCQLTDRSDVYSFGVLLVELASARRPIEAKREMKERLTARWAMSRFIDGSAADVLDPHLARTIAAERALEMLLELVFRCMGPIRQDRPAMSECCRALWAIRKKYREMLAAEVTSQFSDRATGADRSGDLWRI